ncbi:Thioredoxin family protein [Tritrichomonas foetus]|uniref:Thioredoxin family protein n=1 Tax=Tritrichomonas foetus TaxID=1144522 RepID=A0A1J4J5A9_9EUKA|nr:Thioredoxin family protein [Tritrichomonas foetus]|eukprot:OHS94450.1 Thioredoxin family protein [Tritrichomonas foetus]
MAEEPTNLITFEGTVDELYQKIGGHEGPVVVKFGSTTCMPCKRLKQLLPSMARENASTLFLNVEIDQQADPKSYKDAFGITSVPNVFYFKGKDAEGKPQNLGNIVGLQIPQIKAKIAEIQ